MKEQNRSPGEIFAEGNRLAAEAQAARLRARPAALAELGLTVPDLAIFVALYYGLTIPPADLPDRAARESAVEDAWAATEEQCRIALDSCFAKNWVQVIDDSARTRILDELRRDGVLGPVYGMPEAESVDFTAAGADLWRRYSERCGPDNKFFPYPNIIREKIARFFRTSAAAEAAIAECRGWDEVVSVTDPTPIGPWRAQWWRRFPAGYRIDIETRAPWPGSCSGGEEECFLERTAETKGLGQLRHLLDHYKVTLPQWHMLENMERGWLQAPANLCWSAARSAELRLGVELSVEECREGLEACLEKGWLRAVDQSTTDEIYALLRDDPVFLPVPRITENRPGDCCYDWDPLHPGKMVPAPMPPDMHWGEIDFSPSGAELYRTISAEWLGPDWEDNVLISRGSEWEEHHYCEAKEGLDQIVPEYIAKGHIVRSSRVVPIGPWCVNWWKRRPSGYRLELELSSGH